MSFEELAAIGEFIGGVTIVLTLLYIAYETRRNTAIHIASTTSDAYLRWAECNQLIAGEVRVTELWVRIFDNQPLDAFDTVERLQITLEMRALVQRLAAIHQLIRACFCVCLHEIRWAAHREAS
jgi:hypothetical protein